MYLQNRMKKGKSQKYLIQDRDRAEQNKQNIEVKPTDNFPKFA